LPDGNKRTAWLCLREFLGRNGCAWEPSAQDPNDAVATVEGVAAGLISEVGFARWIQAHIHTVDAERKEAS
jgi:prophage maintenance system killer protein